MRRLLSAAAVAAILAAGCASRPAPNERGARVLDGLEAHHQWVRRHPDHQLVEIRALAPSIRVDLGYTRADNFMGEPLYPATAAAWLRRPAAEALARVQQDLEAQGLGLLVRDAYRPYAVTVRMWERIGDPDYVADPADGSRHNRGAAVDVTLVDLATGEELPMPTAWDTFDPRAHHDAEAVAAEPAENRARLLEAMTRRGFEPLPTEWWHYDWRGWRRFPLLDVALEELAAGR